jgi:REP element-mobilizing transposase RayT
MAQTLFCGYFHIVFSTKNRFGFIQPEIEEELYAYIGGIVGNYKGKLISAGGTSNHVHLVASTNKNQLIPDLIGYIKRDRPVGSRLREGSFRNLDGRMGIPRFR